MNQLTQLVMWIHVHIFESLQLEGWYVGDLRYLTVAILKFLVTFEQGVLHFHFALSPANYAACPGREDMRNQEGPESLEFLTLWWVLFWSNQSLKLNIQKTQIMPSGPITSWQIDGETVETVADFILGGSKITADGDWSHEIKRCLLLGRKAITTLDSIFKSRDYFANKGPSSQGYGFSSGHVWMGELDCEESWAPKNWCFWTVVLGDDSWESLGLQGDPTSPFWRSVLGVHWKDWC